MIPLEVADLVVRLEQCIRVALNQGARAVADLASNAAINRDTPYGSEWTRVINS